MSKIIGHELQPVIDEMLKNGLSYRKISDEMKAQGFKVSHATIKGYFDEYGHLIDDSEDFSDDDSISQPIHFDPSKNNTEVLKALVSKQLQILESKQEQYMQGQIPYPMNEIRALKLFVDIMKIEGLHIRHIKPKEESTNLD